MGNKEAAQEAIRDPNPVIDGRKANVNLAYLGAKPRNAANTLVNSAAALAAASKSPLWSDPPVFCFILLNICFIL